MAVTGTGKWVFNTAGTSVQDRDYFSGLQAVNNTAYGTELEFGFSAADVVIVNDSANKAYFQWLSRAGQAVDSGVIPGNSTLSFRSANKTGILLRVESSTSNVYVMAVG